MSTQLDFIMQLYMMNYMQQQQQLYQQQLLIQSPAKPKDIASNNQNSRLNPDPAGTSYAQQYIQAQRQPQPQAQPQRQRPPNTRTQKRKNSQNTNCSSSSSSSPNSTSSAITANIVPSPNLFQQMLLNNLPPLTQFMQMQTAAQALPLLTSASNLLLTPNTPNSSSNTNFGLSTAERIVSSSENPSLINCPRNLSQHFSCNNFLQSSTVTSTPTEKSPTVMPDISAVGDDGVVSAGVDEEDRFVELKQHGSSVEVARSGSSSKTAFVAKTSFSALLDDVSANVGTDDEEEDNKPLSSLHSSSGVASSSSLETSSKFLLCSGVRPLEKSSESADSSQGPSFTPTKQPPDSTYGSQQQTSSTLSHSTFAQSAFNSSTLDSTINAHKTDFDEEIKATPHSLANAILTPPSSEQLQQTNGTFESLQASQPASTAISLSTASSLDAFLQNEENLKNLKKFGSYLECENALCRQENLREHFHCFDVPCQGKILSKKDDIIRHLKWHKKRKESLLLGFARFSAADDCEPSYGAGCAYNWKQTHYHCVYEDCPKVYVSTSDVQMHANFHRKNSEIVQEGFRRFRAHENCKIEDCPFHGKKISHYHCCREGCNHTFKNKADMDKHKSYHLKDYQLTQDGFKKILKTEQCPFEECKFSGVCNHIHCVRGNCNYILHSSTQMISHKRKHDRQDGEQAYQNYKKQKDSSEEEAPAAAPPNLNASTPLSSLPADHFLSRKRGRPPKKIQLPGDNSDSKRIKQEMTNDETSNSASALTAGFMPPFLSNLNPASAAAAAAQTLHDSSAPNFQLTHLMALFQLQNPLFYQNLYPGGLATNMANMLGAAAAAGGLPQNASMFGNLAALDATAGIATSIKSEFNSEKPQE